MTTKQGKPAGSGLQALGFLIALGGMVLAAVGFSDLSSSILEDVSTAVKIQYVLQAGLPALIGGSLVYGVGAILEELSTRTRPVPVVAPPADG